MNEEMYDVELMLKNKETFDLGIMPQGMWIQSRIEDIKGTMSRYFKSNKEIPNEWLIEYNKLIAWRFEINGDN